MSSLSRKIVLISAEENVVSQTERKPEADVIEMEMKDEHSTMRNERDTNVYVASSRRFRLLDTCYVFFFSSFFSRVSLKLV